MVLTRAWRWVITAALAMAASLRCGSGNCCNIRSALNSSGSFTFIPTTSFSSGFNGWLGNKASSPVGSRSPILGLSPQLAAARLCHLMMHVAVGGGSPVPYSSRPFGVASAALVSPVLSAPVAPVAAMSAAGSPAHRHLQWILRRSLWAPSSAPVLPRLCSSVTPVLIRPPQEMSEMCLGVSEIPLAGGSRRQTGMHTRVAGGEVAVAGVAGGWARPR
ncbi:unnamed protein product [Closterium sp. Naga37s-1]|nr:unnamed protein product [Closterium sp. Naga37s-1]